MITTITLTVTLLCSSFSLFYAVLDRDGSKVICFLSGIVAACGGVLLMAGGHWLWGIAGAINLAIVYFRYPVKVIGEDDE